MDDELKAILWGIVVIVVGVVGAQIFYPGGIMALLGVWGK